jgi:hypothetical protein
MINLEHLELRIFNVFFSFSTQGSEGAARKSSKA